MQQGSAPQTCRPVCLPPLIHQQRKADASLRPKRLRVAEIAQPDGRQRRSLIPKGLLMIAQLRNVLAAEDSPIMPQESDHRRPLLPQRSQSHRPRFRVRKHNLRQPRTP